MISARSAIRPTIVAKRQAWRNNGEGTGTDVTATARVGDPRWSAGCAFADRDRDGDLDLLVTNNGQDAELLRNDGGNRANALLVRLRGSGRKHGGDWRADLAHDGIEDATA